MVRSQPQLLQPVMEQLTTHVAAAKEIDGVLPSLLALKLLVQHHDDRLDTCMSCVQVCTDSEAASIILCVASSATGLPRSNMIVPVDEF